MSDKILTDDIRAILAKFPSDVAIRFTEFLLLVELKLSEKDKRIAELESKISELEK